MQRNYYTVISSNLGLPFTQAINNKKRKVKDRIHASTRSRTTLDRIGQRRHNKKLISLCQKILYLRSIYTPLLKTSIDIQNRINKAQHLFFSLRKFLFQNIEIGIKIKRRVYIASIVNILL